MNTKKNISIGIWGYGIVGKAAVNYFLKQGYTVGLMDKKELIATEIDYLKKNNIRTYSEAHKNQFFNSSDIIIPSPGINISQSDYATHLQKWSFELDFFYQSFHKPIIAITGSIGKTSTTSLLEQIFKKSSIPIVTGGNIGISTFDLINAYNKVNFALLEVSSFQLMHCKHFAPFLSVWTNFHPNHLDYHHTESNYFLAKSTILNYQKEGSLSLIPWSLRGAVPAPQTMHTRAYFSLSFPNIAPENNLRENEIIYYINNNAVMKYSDKIHIPLLLLSTFLLELSFLENIIILVAVCDLLKIDNQVLYDISLHLEHRIEHIATFNDITFYNDSKSTTTASTEAAVTKLCHRPLHLFLGGLSKGVDRTLFVKDLKDKIKHIYCFGKEADFLYTVCNENGIPATPYSNLENAVNACVTLMQPGDCVLLSPAGSSYDLYDNYEQRGNHFKKLITAILKRHNP